MKTGRPKGEPRPPDPDKVKTALQMSGVYGRTYDPVRITLPPVTMWLKFKEEQEKQAR
jgi:hypothetical protein